MIDIDYLNFLENILTDNRKEVLKVLENRTNHFTIAVEDIDAQYQCSDAQLQVLFKS
jgi:tRNA (guanosine-2'-O-)-methyltransferase